jgi:VCBS repeat-containing protein
MNKNILTIATALFVGGSLFLTSCKKDETAPVITLSGDSVQTISLNASLLDPGATADDEKDGAITAITSDYTTAVNKDSAGTYTVTYTASDSKDNQGTKMRTVIVKNDAETFFASNYNASEIDALGPYTYSGNTDAAKVITITASKSKNNRIWINRLGDFANNKIYMDVTGNSIDIPQQTVSNVGTGTTASCEIHNRKSSGTGSKTSNGFTLTYSDEKLAPCTGNRTDVIATFIKK